MGEFIFIEAKGANFGSLLYVPSNIHKIANKKKKKFIIYKKLHAASVDIE